MTFISHIGVAFALIVAGAIVAIDPSSSPEAAKGSFFVGTVSAQIWIFCAALVLRARRTPRFDMVVAAELLIAMGVFSLITGIVISGIGVLRDFSRFAGSPFQILQVVVVPFGEGLFASGLAPLLASVLRQIEVLRYGLDDGRRDGDEPDLPGLAVKIREATASLDSFSAAWKRCETMLDGAGATLKAAADTYAQAAQRVDKALSGLAGDIEKAAGASLNDFNSRTKATTKSLEDMTVKTKAFSDATVEGTTLLTGLQNLIESVTNFVRPDDRMRP
jgi:hypothetical protein